MQKHKRGCSKSSVQQLYVMNNLPKFHENPSKVYMDTQYSHLTINLYMQPCGEHLSQVS